MTGPRATSINFDFQKDNFLAQEFRMTFHRRTRRRKKKTKRGLKLCLPKFSAGSITMYSLSQQKPPLKIHMNLYIPMYLSSFLLKSIVNTFDGTPKSCPGGNISSGALTWKIVRGGGKQHPRLTHYRFQMVYCLIELVGSRMGPTKLEIVCS